MKLSELIAQAQGLLKEKGDLEIISSTDDEGNAYRPVDNMSFVYHVDYEDIFDTPGEASDYYDFEDLTTAALLW